jgi:hypothetical protein
MSFIFIAMNKTIRLCYRKIIDSNSPKMWEKMVFEESFLEFKMQAQRFNPGNKYNSFSDILLNNSTAEQLHFLVSGAVVGYIKQLNERVPDIINTLGKHFLPFKQFRFEIINSDIKDITKHKIAVNFFSEPVTWVDTIGDTLVVSVNNVYENDELLTDTVTMIPFLSIYSIKYSG